MKEYKQATIALPNGWYTVAVLAGLTHQVTEIETTTGKIEKIESVEPTFEFILKPCVEKPEYTADFNYQFRVDAE